MQKQHNNTMLENAPGVISEGLNFPGATCHQTPLLYELCKARLIVHPPDNFVNKPLDWNAGVIS